MHRLLPLVLVFTLAASAIPAQEKSKPVEISLYELAQRMKKNPDQWDIDFLGKVLRVNGYILEPAQTRGEGKDQRHVVRLVTLVTWQEPGGKVGEAEPTPETLKYGSSKDKRKNGLDFSRIIDSHFLDPKEVAGLKRGMRLVIEGKAATRGNFILLENCKLISKDGP